MHEGETSVTRAGRGRRNERFNYCQTLQEKRIYCDSILRELATRAMTLHLLATQDGAGSGMTFEKVDVLENHYADTSRLKWLQRSPWGQLYWRLYKDYVGNPVKIRIIEH